MGVLVVAIMIVGAGKSFLGAGSARVQTIALKAS